MSWFDQAEVQVIDGDILSLDVEAVGCGIKTSLEFYGAIGNQLGLRCGETLKDTIRRALDDRPGRRLQLGEALTVPVTSLGTIQKVILIAYWADDNEYTARLVYKSYVNALREAFAHNVRALALPLLGAKPWSKRFGEFGATLLKVLHDLDELPTSDGYPVSRLCFVSNNSVQVAALRQRFDDEL